MAVTPEEGAPITEEQAVAQLSSLLEEPQGDPKAEEEKVQATHEEQPEPAGEEPATSEEETEEAEPQEAGEELPDTLDGLAEALDIPAEELAGHLKVQAKVRGESMEVTLAEAVRGYQREADYSRQTMELAEQRKAFEAQAKQATERWQQQMQGLDQAIQSAQSVLDASLSDKDLDQLIDEDPAAYIREVRKRESAKATLAQAEQDRKRLQADQERHYLQGLQTYRKEQQQALAAAMPELKDPVKLEKFQRDTAKYLSGRGFEAEQISEFFGSAYDHRMVLVLSDAAKWRALQAGRKDLPKKLQSTGRVLKPGAARRETGQDKVVASKTKLRQLRGKGTRQQQEKAAVDYVKNLL